MSANNFICGVGGYFLKKNIFSCQKLILNLITWFVHKLIHGSSIFYQGEALLIMNRF